MSLDETVTVTMEIAGIYDQGLYLYHLVINSLGRKPIYMLVSWGKKGQRKRLEKLAKVGDRIQVTLDQSNWKAKLVDFKIIADPDQLQ